MHGKHRLLLPVFCILLLIELSVQIFDAQSPPLAQPVRPPGSRSPDYISTNNDARERFERQLPRRSAEVPSSGSDIRNSSSLPYIKANGKPFTPQELADMKKRAEPDAADLGKYRELLSGPNAGSFKIFPDINCVTNFVVNFDERCSGFVIGGSLFSFRRKDHLETAAYDIRLGDKEDLIADGFLNQSIMVPLGNIELGQVTTSTPGLETLTRFQPKTDLAEAKTQFRETAGMVKIGNFSYSKRVLAVVGNTYAVRCSAYVVQVKKKWNASAVSRSAFYMWSLVNSDARLDLTVAFTIVKRGEDGSFTIVWKQLGRSVAPIMQFDSIEDISDVQ